MRPRRRACIAITSACLFALPSAYAVDKPVRLVVSIAAGGATDVVVRTIGTGMAKILGTTVIVDNKPGGNGTVAAAAVATPRPEEITMLFIPSSIVQNASLRTDIPNYLPKLTPVGLAAVIPVALVVSPDLGPKNLKEFIALAKSKPGALSFASPGSGSSSHILGEVLARETGTKLIHVPYKGEAQSVPDVFGGRLSSAFGAVGSLEKYEANGKKLVLLAVTGAQRLRSVPNIPTFEEQGVPNMTLLGWMGTFVANSTPKETVNKLAEALQLAVATPEVQSVCTRVGFECRATSPEEFSAHLDKELKAWPELVKGLDISFQ
ncbi:tripartite tricarboxylate transporter substrate binding protein [Pseudorhodoferax sp. Leaf265]|uniref:Bug family tripartite tricarboxylate transporter substrate binding protein n=1 Tax=Pseudorhodoferax sp. Leaf265 TaxID=1736315 RepID=UPI0009E829BE|nr:tripartite tricarboxylate transporter substrate binding protein [Pseudorhodoferax sp. Leaf265]